jgi:hypothetical protein
MNAGESSSIAISHLTATKPSLLALLPRQKRLYELRVQRLLSCYLRPKNTMGIWETLSQDTQLPI